MVEEDQQTDEAEYCGKIALSLWVCCAELGKHTGGGNIVTHVYDTVRDGDRTTAGAICEVSSAKR